MSVDCSFAHPLVRDGVSQRQRAARGLDPASAKLDGRSTADLLAFLMRYAELLRYYDASNQPAGDWVDFLAQDASSLVVAIARHDTASVRSQYLATRAAASGAPESEWPSRYAALVNEMIALARQFEVWYRRLPSLGLRSFIERLIRSTLAEQLHGAQCERARLHTLGLTVPDIAAAFAFEPWPPLRAAPDAPIFLSGWPAPVSERNDAVARITQRLERMHEALVATVAKAREPSAFAETLTAYPRHSPDMAVLLAFLDLYKHAQSELNGFTGRHLDFYYSDVLQLAARGAVADRVHVAFELAKNARTTLLPAGTVLDAGKDAGAKPKPLEYVTERAIAVNAARIQPEIGLKSVFVERDETTGAVRNIYAAPRADSADGLGAALEGDEKKWLVFGDRSMPYATIGFAIASAMFEMAEGARTLRVTLQFAAPVALAPDKTIARLQRELLDGITAQASGAEGWIDVHVGGVTLLAAGSAFSNATFDLDIEADAPAIVGYAEETLQAGYATTLPVLRFLLRNEALAAGALVSPRRASNAVDYSDEIAAYPANAIVRHERTLYEARVPIEQAGYRPADHPLLWRRLDTAYAYESLRRAELAGVDISVQVRGVRDLVIETDAGPVDPGKPFHPFGAVPRTGSALRIGSTELFRKEQIDALWLTFAWSGLPETPFQQHYANYSVNGISTARFTVTPSMLVNGQWEPLRDGPQRLFDDNSDHVPNSTHTIDLTDRRLGGDPSLEFFDQMRPGARRGFLCLSLNKSFLHEQYATALAKQIKDGGTLPLPPYTPLASSLVLDYNASAALDYTATRTRDFATRTSQIFHIEPFGSREIFPIADDPTAANVPIERRLLPQFDLGDESDTVAEGTLYLGIEKLVPPQTLAVLFQVAEGSEDPELPAPRITWSYLAGERWQTFGPTEIPSEGTNGLLASGVVEFAAPKAMTVAEHVLPQGLHWIRATVASFTGAIPRLIGIHTQAVTAVFRDSANDPAHLATPLPAGTIAKLKSRNAAIKAVAQPYASFGARMQETPAQFRPRVAERLRHKGQAVAIFDYERLVLDRFPEVYKVKCISHASGDLEYSPGHVKLVVVPNLRNRNAVDPLRPRLSLAKLEAIRAFLQPRASDFVTLQVANPSYEEVRARFRVRLKPGCDKGLHAQLLSDELVRFLSPWLYDDALDIALGGRIHRSDLIEFIDGREYVDFVADFEIDHIVDGIARLNVEEARATNASAALVSAASHEIDTDVVSCEDEPPVAPPGPSAEPTPPTPSLPPWAKRYLGNTNSREIHDVTNLQPDCQEPEIRPDHRYYFSRVADALAMGYDCCAYCFPGLSRR